MATPARPPDVSEVETYVPGIKDITVLFLRIHFQLYRLIRGLWAHEFLAGWLLTLGKAFLTSETGLSFSGVSFSGFEWGVESASVGLSGVFFSDVHMLRTRIWLPVAYTVKRSGLFKLSFVNPDTFGSMHSKILSYEAQEGLDWGHGTPCLDSSKVCLLVTKVNLTMCIQCACLLLPKSLKSLQCVCLLPKASQMSWMLVSDCPLVYHQASLCLSTKCPSKTRYMYIYWSWYAF